MAHLTWKLDDERYCYKCPCHEVVKSDSLYILHNCKAGFYKEVALLSEFSKRRPSKCVKELGK